MGYRVAFLSLHGCPVARLGEKDTGGMNVYLKETAKHLGKLGIKIDVYTRVHDPNDEEVIQLGINARVIHLKAGEFNQKKEDLYRAGPEFVENVLRFQKHEKIEYNLVHSHYWLSNYPGITLSKSWSVPLVSTFHTLAKLKLRAKAEEMESIRRIESETDAVLRSDGIVVSTDSEVLDINQLYVKSDKTFDDSKIKVITPGVNLQVFQPGNRSKAKEKLSLSSGKMVLYAGRVEPLKGIDIAINAISKLELNEVVDLIVVGGDSTSDTIVAELKELARSFGIYKQVKFVGSVRQSLLAEFYRAADALIFPSYYESFGLVALEAMASGTPVVASRVGGLPQLIKNGETGYLVPFRCPESFTEKLEVILSNPILQDAIGASARRDAMDYSWGNAAKKLARFYFSLSGQYSLASGSDIKIV
ncbi:MAG: glycosyltransferase family 1 protein [SAR202 cluster bacterium]|nr:glycosyltransferase family 1 protein [SAR202 cluster bacterium]